MFVGPSVSAQGVNGSRFFTSLRRKQQAPTSFGTRCLQRLDKLWFPDSMPCMEDLPTFTVDLSRNDPKCVLKNPVIFRFYAKAWEFKPPVKCI